MGFLKYLNEYFEKRKTRQVFREHASPEVLKLLERNPSKYNSLTLGKKHFQFILVELKDVEVYENSDVLDTIVDILFQNKAILINVSRSVLMGMHGLPYPEMDVPALRLKAVKELSEKCGNQIRIAHGQCNGFVGNIGSEQRHSYGAVIPDQYKILKKLLELPFGSAFEVPENPT